MELLRKIYNDFKISFSREMPVLFGLLDRYKLLVKYIFSGGTSSLTDLALLYIFTDLFHIHYLISATLAFIIAFFVSFYLQKFWTFRNNDREKMYRQMTMYFIVGLIGLGINSLGMYLLVDFAGIMYILAQIIMSAMIAFMNFAIYRFIIFKIHPNEA